MITSSNKQAVPYLRTARVDMGDFSSLVRQKELIEEYCSENNIEIKNVFWDVASGTHFNRNGWKELEDYLSHNSGNIHFVISVNPSRVGRNFELFLSEEKRFQEKYNVAFCYCDKSQDKQSMLAQFENIK